MRKSTCRMCGALVVDEVKHLNWHRMNGHHAAGCAALRPGFDPPLVCTCLGLWATSEQQRAALFA